MKSLTTYTVLGAIIMAAAGLFPSIVYSHGTLDQSFVGAFEYGPCTGYDAFYTEGNSVGQTFTSGPTVNNITGFDLWFAFGSGAGATFAIREFTDFGVPGTVLATSGPASPDGSGFYHFDLAAPVPLASSTKYAITDANHTEVCFQADLGGDYSGGGMVNAFYPGGVFGGYYEDSSFDALFRTYHCPDGGTDTDGDGLDDACDADDDNDGLPDASDAFPLNPSESVDTDLDGIGNNADTDDDGDGVADNVDGQPLTFGDSFADTALGGATTGTILARNGHSVTITDATPNPARGVTVVVDPGAGKAVFRLDNKASILQLSPGTYTLTDPLHTTTIDVSAGGPAEYQATLFGEAVAIVIAAGGSATITEDIDAGGSIVGIHIDAVSGSVTLNGQPVTGPMSVSTTPTSTSASLNTGCSSSSTNGALKVYLKFKITASSTRDIDSLTLTVVDIPGSDLVLSKADGDIGASFSYTVPPLLVPAIANTTTDYLATLTVNGEGSSATRTAKATLTVNRSGTSASCSIRSPAP